MKDQKPTLHEDTCKNVFAASATLLGVCLTVIGIIRVIISISKTNTLADDFLCFAALLFLAACLSSYWAMRTQNLGRMHRVEQIADISFIAGLCVMAGVCVFITYAIVVI